MSSPITFSGFNNIDFNSVVTALMAEASQPLTNLKTNQSNLQSKATQLTALTGQVSTLQSAVDALSTADSLTSFTTTSSDSSAVNVTASAQAAPGHYDVVVQDLARAQVTASASTAPDANTTIVASSGKITIGGVDVSITQNTTLQGLADAINSTSGVPVRASVVQSNTNSFRLVLTASASGTANAFTVVNTLAGGAPGSNVTFTDTDSDGITGNSDADNAVKASNASVLVNNVQIISSSNTLTTAIPGATLTLTKKDPNTAVGVDITPDTSALRSNLSSFITAYNSLMSFASAQDKRAANGDTTSLGRDPGLRALRTSLRSALTSSYANSGTLQYLSQLGVEFMRDGTLQLNTSVFNSATLNGTGDAQKLLTGTSGLFTSLSTTLTNFTASTGLLPTEQQQITRQISSLGDQIDAMQSRLDLQKASLQAEFAAADMAMSQLSNQSGSISSLSVAKQ